MLYNYPTIIADGFFKYPLEVRDFALNLEYTPCMEGKFSGTRTDSLHKNHLVFFEQVINKILDCYSLQRTEYAASMHFHLTSEEFGDSGWVHCDAEIADLPSIASIVYLNLDNTSIDNGTTIYNIKTMGYDDRDCILERKRSFLDRKDNTMARKKHNQNFNPTVKIGNIFNRMVAYDNRNPHAGASYFGDNCTSSRLTLLTFFYSIKTFDNLTPLQRAELHCSL
tara:strand:- start:18 stop:689 length:672 start_codon:yes stop_codon:yes gene_type:complete